MPGSVLDEVSVTKTIMVDGALRADLVRAIMDAWARGQPEQTSTMALQASEAVIAMLMIR